MQPVISRDLPMRTSIAALAILAGIAATPAFAADDTAMAEFSIGGYVPVICRAQLSASTAPVAANTATFGPVEMLCNEEAGFRLVLQHEPGVRGQVQLGGRVLDLEDDADTVLIDSNHASYDVQPLSITFEGDQAPAWIRLTITPKGAAFAI